MSRLPTIYQNDNQQLSSKLAMLDSNITRVHNQNRKLQVLIDNPDNFDRLKQFVKTVQMNWKRVNQITDKLKLINSTIKTSRQTFHNQVSQYYQHINGDTLIEMQNLKINVKQYQNKLNQIKLKWNGRVHKQIQNIKEKQIKNINQRNNQYIIFLQKIQNHFKNECQQQIIPYIISDLEDQFKDKYIDARTQMGHLQNLIHYFHFKNKNIQQNNQQYNRNDIQVEYNQHQQNLTEVINCSCEDMMNRTVQLNFKLKKVSSEIQWLKTQQQRAKNKKVNNKTDHSMNSFEPCEGQLASQLSFQTKDINTQIVGLAKYYDRLLIIRKLLRSKLQDKSILQDNQLKLIQKNKHKMLNIKSKIDILTKEITDCLSFYKQFSN